MNGLGTPSEGAEDWFCRINLYHEGGVLKNQGGLEALWLRLRRAGLSAPSCGHHRIAGTGASTGFE